MNSRAHVENETRLIGMMVDMARIKGHGKIVQHWVNGELKRLEWQITRTPGESPIGVMDLTSPEEPG
jgi:hypothetical protein